MSYKTIQIEHRERVAILTFDRPKVLNAFDAKLVDETRSALAELGANDGVMAIVVRGAGRAFSAGFDMKAALAAPAPPTPAEWREVLENDFAFIMGFWDCPKPTIAAVHGYCIGGAFELSLGCDITIAAAGTKFGAPEVRFGSGAVALLLPWIAGPKAAKELLLTGEDKLTAERALSLGIVNHAVPREALMDRAIELALEFAAKSPVIMALGRGSFMRANDLDYRRNVENQIETLCNIFSTPDGKEGLLAFLEKRAPRWA